MKKQVCLSSALIIAAAFLSGCGSFGDSINDIDDLKGKKVAAQLDTTAFSYASNLESADVRGYNASVDMFSALNKEIVDAVVIDEATAEMYANESDDSFRLLDEKFSSEEYVIAFNKNNQNLGIDLNDAISQLEKKGVIDEIVSHWIGEKADKVSYVPDEDIERDGELIMYTNAVYPPYESFLENGIAGIDVDIMRAICDVLGKELTIENKSFSEIFDCVEKKENAVGVAAISATSERKAQVDFTKSYVSSKQVVVVKNSKAKKK